MNPATMAKFAPLTAVRCVSPDLRIATANCGVCREVSPKINPGINPPVSEAIRDATLRNSRRIFAVSCSSELACRTTSQRLEEVKSATTFRSFVIRNRPRQRI